jgi:DNA-binding MarR family transcriptional regulator
MSTKSIDPVDVLEAVHGLMHAFRAQQYAAQEIESLALTHLEGKTLGMVARVGQTRQADLVAALGRDKGQVTRLIAGLRDRGFLTTAVDAQDRRAVQLTLTPKGRSALGAVNAQLERVADRACEGLSAAEMRRLVQALEGMKERLSADRESTAGSPPS